MSRNSFLMPIQGPAVLLTDGLIVVPLHAVAVVSLSQTYHMPPFNAGLGRAMIDTHDDALTFSAMLVGPERLALRLALETLAESAMRGSPLSLSSGGMLDGLVLVTPLGIRLNMFVQSLSVTASAAKLAAFDINITLVQAPKLGLVGKLLDVAVSVAGLDDGTGGN